MLIVEILGAWFALSFIASIAWSLAFTRLDARRLSRGSEATVSPGRGWYGWRSVALGGVLASLIIAWPLGPALLARNRQGAATGSARGADAFNRTAQVALGAGSRLSALTDGGISNPFTALTRQSLQPQSSALAALASAVAPRLIAGSGGQSGDRYRRTQRAVSAAVALTPGASATSASNRFRSPAPQRGAWEHSHGGHGQGDQGNGGHGHHQGHAGPGSQGSPAGPSDHGHHAGHGDQGGRGNGNAASGGSAGHGDRGGGKGR